MCIIYYTKYAVIYVDIFILNVHTYVCKYHMTTEKNTQVLIARTTVIINITFFTHL